MAKHKTLYMQVTRKKGLTGFNNAVEATVGLSMEIQEQYDDVDDVRDYILEKIVAALDEAMIAETGPIMREPRVTTRKTRNGKKLPRESFTVESGVTDEDYEEFEF